MDTTQNQNIRNGEYANPEALVNTDWIPQHLNDPNVRIIESNEDVLLYDSGHIPGAVHVDWHKDLNDQTIRDYLNPEQFVSLASRIGITPETTIWYYDAVLAKMGKNQSKWLRLFMAPGMGHCGGGPGVNTFDSIGTLEKWVEKEIAPDQMMGTGAQGLRRPLCPYPQYAEYQGTGDLKSAANWACKAPATAAGTR